MPASVQFQGTRQVFGPGGKVRFYGLAGGAVPSSTVQTFTVKNDGAATHAYYLTGLDFAKGACPSGSVPVIKRGSTTLAAQFLDRTTWADGSLQSCTVVARDSDWTVPETSRSLTAEVASGSFDDTGTLVLADITGAYDCKVDVSSCSYWGNGSTGTWLSPGTGVPSGGTDGDRYYRQSDDTIYEKQSGSWVTISADGARTSAEATTDFNTAAGVSATKFWSGPIVEGWWTLDDVGTDTDLQCKHWVWAFKDAGGDIAFIHYVPVFKLTKWKSTTKYMLEYTATVKNGATTLATYANVKHPYHSTWAAIDNTDDVYHGKPHTIGTTADRMIYIPDVEYWTEAGTLPPMNWSGSINSAATFGWTDTYDPCGNMSHRAIIGEGGHYPGRGMLSDQDMAAILNQTHADFRAARIAAYASLHIPEHYTDDTTDTVKVLILQGNGNTAGDYDFTGDGLPAAVHAYVDERSASGNRDSYGTYRGGGEKPRGKWLIEGFESTHACNYAFFMWKVERWPHLLEAMIEHACGRANSNLDTRAIQSQLFPSLISGAAETFSGLYCIDGFGSRGLAWSCWLVNGVASIIPPGRAEYNYVRKLASHNAEFYARSISEHMTADWLANGRAKTETAVFSPWMQNFCVLTLYQLWRMTESAEIKTIADHTAKKLPQQWTKGTAYAWTYRALDSVKSDTWNESTNPMLPAEDIVYAAETASVSAATDKITTNFVASGGDLSAAWSDGDEIVFAHRREADASANTSGDVTLGQTYYVVNAEAPVGNTQAFQVSTTPGGAAVNFTADVSNIGIGGVKATADPSTLGTTADPSGYVAIARAALVMGHVAGNAAYTDALLTKANTYCASINYATGGTFNLAEPS